MLVERHLAQFLRIPPHEILVFLTNFFLPKRDNFMGGKKPFFLFPFFSTLVRVFAWLYANTPASGPNRVKYRMICNQL